MIFCKHNYKKIAKKESTYCQDYLTFANVVKKKLKPFIKNLNIQ